MKRQISRHSQFLQPFSWKKLKSQILEFPTKLSAIPIAVEHINDEKRLL